ELLFAFRWSDEANEKGIPGSVCNPSSLAGTHGSGSPYVLNNTLIAWGEGIKEGIVSEVPCGIVDVAPTALYLLGLRPPSSMDGRVLYELLRDGPDVAAVSVSRRVREAVYPLAEGGRRLRVRYSYVDGTEYLDEITLDMSQQRR
ncbi:MAG: hypothetical protein H5T69_15015, partial [Chloroflexi bacterium]|nr:hypothetical protein [Chloroflexota bacterium]